MDDMLLEVKKPAQYIGREWNSSRKDFSKSDIKFALIFPDLYEVGLSNLGIRIIYGLLNADAGICCERFFSPGLDMEDALRKNGRPLVSLESGKQLREFDILGFSLASEFCYTNALNIFDLGAIPFDSRQRGSDFPLVIAGGPCALNPEPMHSFFDIFIIGEAEEVLPEFIQRYRIEGSRYKQGRINKDELLLSLSQIEGVYAPSLYEVSYGSQGKHIEYFRPRFKCLPTVIRKRFVRDLDAAYFPSDWVVPYVQIIHDRLTLEIMRGCPNQCSFCQARLQYFPLRKKSIGRVLDLARESCRLSGYEEISLLGLSVSDYPGIQELLSKLVGECREKGIGVSLPSVKASAMVGELAELIATIKKTGLTFAPEAGTQRLRGLLGKPFDEAEFFQALAGAYRSGYQHVKLYFMTGIPTEEEHDLAAIVDFAQRASALKKESGGSAAEINISVNTLIPKPHTQMERFAMNSIQEMENKRQYLRQRLGRNRKLRLSFSNPWMSFLEGVLCRGDRRLAPAILKAFQKGARFEAWSDHFKPDYWLDSFKECDIEPMGYLAARGKDELLPWDFINLRTADNH